MPNVQDIELKDPRSEELLAEAEAEFEELTEQIKRQQNGELPEGEKLSGEELEQRSQAVEDKYRLVKSYENLAGAENLQKRLAESPGEFGEAAQYVLANAEVTDGKGESDEGSVFGESSLDFLKACVAASGGSVDYDWNEERAAKMRQLQQASTQFDKGQRFEETAIKAGEIDPRDAQKALQGDNNTALVPTPHMERLLRVMAEGQVFVNRATRIAMQRRDVDFPRLDQTDMTNTRPIFSIAAVSIVSEGGQKPEREPSFEQFTLTAHKYAAYTEISDELLAESIIDIDGFVTENMSQAIGFEFDFDCLANGSGSGEPQSVIGSSAEWVQNRTNAGEVVLGDITGLEERFFGTDGIYYMHPTVFSELVELAESNIITFNDDVASAAPGTLLGRPIQRSFKMDTLGNKGDLALLDPTFYIVGDLQQMTFATSTDFKFRNDLTSIRAVFRAAGAPWPNGLFSHRASSGAGGAQFRISPFTTLGDVATS